jgi:hypothetical protein
VIITRYLIVFGITLVVAGLSWPFLQKLGVGRLPGDFVLSYGGISVYVPLGISVVISLLFTAILWLMNR